MPQSDLLQLIGTGLGLGVVHVLTGPDHLSALATLSANVGNTVEAAFLGIRWGIGHSSGLLLVGSILIALSNSSGQDTVDMPDYASTIFESLVGVFMLLLGAHGVRRAWHKRPTAYNAIEGGSPTAKEAPHSHGADGIFRLDSIEQDSLEQEEGEEEPSPSQTLEIHLDGDESPVCFPPSLHEPSASPCIVTVLSDGSDFEEAVVVEQEYLQTVSPSRFRRWFFSLRGRISNKTMAFCIGIVHGLAGPGGVLGVIPAVELQNWKLAALYLSCFCVSSTLTMGCFATLYGACSTKIGSGREFQMECFSACLSILVGILWLTLLYFGKLQDVFP